MTSQLAYAPAAKQTDSKSHSTQPSKPKTPRAPKHAVRPVFQRKLAVSTPGDNFEREADTTADHIMTHTPTQPVRRCACGGIINASGECDKCHRRRLGLQRSATNGAALGGVPSSVQRTVRGPGKPLQAPIRSFMEARFRRDFSDVQVHTDREAQQSAHEVNAHAYTVGNHIVFAQGQFNPNSPGGQHLIAHELTHVVQQSAARDMPTRIAPTDSAAEHEADRASTAIHPRVVHHTPAQIARAPADPKYQTASSKTLEIMKAMGEELAALRSAEPPAKGAAQEAQRTFCIIKVVAQDGKIKTTVTGKYLGKGPHAEEAAIAKLNVALVEPTDTVLVTVDQFPCADKCTPALDRLRAETQGEFRVFHEVAVDPATRTVARSPKTVATNPKGTTEMMELNEFHRAPSTPPPSSTAAPPEAAPPKAAPAAAPEVAAEPHPEIPPKAKLAPSPTPEPPAEPSIKPNASGKWTGVGGGLLSIFAPIILGIVHQKAVEKRVEKQANEQGYVSPNAPSGHGLLYDLGAWLLDPFRSAEKSVSIDKRFNLPVWRERIRTEANKLKPGDIFKMTWDIGLCSFDVFGNQEIEQREITYTKQPNGLWKATDGNATGTPDLNNIISTAIPDDRIRAMVEYNPCTPMA